MTCQWQLALIVDTLKSLKVTVWISWGVNIMSAFVNFQHFCSLFTFIPIEWLPIQHTKKHLWVTYDKMCVKRTWLILNGYTYIKCYPNSSQISSWLPSCLVLKFCDVTAKNVNKSHVGHLGWLIWKISHFSLDINWKHNSRIFIFACMALE